MFTDAMAKEKQSQQQPLKTTGGVVKRLNTLIRCTSLMAALIGLSGRPNEVVMLMRVEGSAEIQHLLPPVQGV